MGDIAKKLVLGALAALLIFAAVDLARADAPPVFTPTETQPLVR